MDNNEKTQLNMRVDSMALEVFKSQADARGLTQVQYFEQISKDSNDGKTIEFLSSRLESKDDEIKQLESIIQRYEKNSGKKITDTRKVTFTVTNEQFEWISNLAHERKIAKTHLLSEIIPMKQQPQNTLMLQ